MALIPEFISIVKDIRDRMYPVVESVYSEMFGLVNARVTTPTINVPNNADGSAGTGNVVYNKDTGEFTFSVPIGATGADFGIDYAVATLAQRDALIGMKTGNVAFVDDTGMIYTYLDSSIWGTGIVFTPAEVWTALTDTPDDYVGKQLQFVQCRLDEQGVQFVSKDEALIDEIARIVVNENDIASHDIQIGNLQTEMDNVENDIAINGLAITANENAIISLETANVDFQAGIDANTLAILNNSGDISNNELAIATNTSNINLKAPKANPVFTGTVSGISKTMVGLGNVDNTADANKTVANLTGLTSTIVELNKIDGFIGSFADLNYAKDLRATGVTSTEFDALDGVTSNIQTQLNNIDASGIAHDDYATSVLGGTVKVGSNLSIANGVLSANSQLSTNSIYQSMMTDNSVGKAEIIADSIGASELSTDLLGGDGSTSVTGGTAYLFTAGWYVLPNIKNLVLEVYVSGAWRGNSITSSGSAGLVVSDGTNVRIKNIQIDPITAYWKKLSL